VEEQRLGEAVRLFKQYSSADDGGTTAAVRDDLMKLWTQAECNRLTNIRAGANRKAGNPGPEGSTGKLSMAELNKKIYEFCVGVMGPDAMLYGDYDRSSHAGMFSADVQRSFLRSRANSIEGGTSEVMRNILGERVLGLPGDVRVDKGKAWLEVPRN
jgi:alkylation response protein AidB-like acyl-CoA dehydrogenase